MHIGTAKQLASYPNLLRLYETLTQEVAGSHPLIIDEGGNPLPKVETLVREGPPDINCPYALKQELERVGNGIGLCRYTRADIALLERLAERWLCMVARLPSGDAAIEGVIELEELDAERQRRRGQLH